MRKKSEEEQRKLMGTLESITRENTQVVGIQERLETAKGVESFSKKTRQEPLIHLEKDINIQVL